jgi:hypothetical protein
MAECRDLSRFLSDDIYDVAECDQERKSPSWDFTYLNRHINYAAVMHEHFLSKGHIAKLPFVFGPRNMYKLT